MQNNLLPSPSGLVDISEQHQNLLPRPLTLESMFSCLFPVIQSPVLLLKTQHTWEKLKPCSVKIMLGREGMKNLSILRSRWERCRIGQDGLQKVSRLPFTHT